MATFAPPTIPWLQAQPLQLSGLNLGPGLEDFELAAALQRLCVLPEVQAVVAFGSRGRGDAQADSDLDLAVIAKQPQLNPQAKLQLWKQCRAAVGSNLNREFGTDAGGVIAEQLSDVVSPGRVAYVDVEGGRGLG